MVDDKGVVLVVDDDPLNRAILTRALQRDGHVFRIAASGEEALRSLREEPAAVVLLDVVMPGMDGVEVLEELKRDTALRDVPVIMISALDDYERVVHCIEIGAEDYLPKPFDPAPLRHASTPARAARLNALERNRVRGAFARFLPESMSTTCSAEARHLRSEASDRRTRSSHLRGSRIRRGARRRTGRHVLNRTSRR